MPFLVPALVALPADFLILWLNRLGSSSGDHDQDQHGDRGSGTNDANTAAESMSDLSLVYHVEYLAPLALIRIILLLTSLLFHSYTGTAIRCPYLYHVLYWVTLTVCLTQMLALAFMNPTSLESIIPNTRHLDEMTTAAAATLTAATAMSVYEMRRIWWMLIATTVSDSCHIVMLWHVRSTAPYNLLAALGRGSHHKPPSVYFALRSLRGNGRGNSSNDRNEYDVMVEPALVHAMNEFIVDVQSRVLRAKDEWTRRLDDFSARHMLTDHHMHGHHGHHQTMTTGNNDRTTTTAVVTSATAATTTAATTFKATPFRVLLQLFAYEDVLENGRLDAAYEMDDGQTMIFYIPQLLSFLLHGALYCSPALEAWILDRCTKDVHFAHKCYWFLRAWCLEVPGEAVVASSISRQNSEVRLSQLGLLVSNGNNGHNDEASNSTLFLDEPASPDLSVLEDENGDSVITPRTQPTSSRRSSATGGVAGGAMRNSTVSSSSTCGGLVGNALLSATKRRPSLGRQLSGGAASGSSTAFATPALPPPQQQLSDKLLPEERALIERLLLRVKECGEGPARQLEYGSTAESAVGSAAAVDVAEDDAVQQSPVADLEAAHNKQQQPVIVDLLLPSKPPSSRNRNAAQANTTRLESIDTAADDAVDESCVTTPAALERAIKMGSIPVDPVTGSPSARHMESTSAPQDRKYGFTPLKNVAKQQQQKQHCQNGQGPAHNETEAFDHTTRFLDALIYLAESLFYVPRERRKDELRKQLAAMECELLPSNSIYIPVGSGHHRVWRICAEESIPINTKERVPCIICLEVVDYAPRQQRRNSSIRREAPRSSWGFLDRLPRPRHQFRSISTESSFSSGVVPVLPSLPPSPHLTNTSALPRHPRDTSVTSEQSATQQEGMNASHSHMDDALLSEADLVKEWRYARRDPSRRVSLLDKVTSTMRDSMKTTHQMMSRFSNNSEHLRPSFEEMQSLTDYAGGGGGDRVAQSSPSTAYSYPTGATMEPRSNNRNNDLLDRSDSGMMASLAPDTSQHRATIDLEPGGTLTTSNMSLPAVGSEEDPRQLSDAAGGGGSASQNLSRTSSGGSLASMGQWSSPVPVKPIVQVTPMPSSKNNATKRGSHIACDPDNIRRRTSRDSVETGTNLHLNNSISNINTTLTYGSDHGEDTPPSRRPSPPRRRHSGSSATGVPVSDNSIASTATKKRSRPPVVFREGWWSKQERVRARSLYGKHPGWRLLPILIKANDDLRQEQLASQIIYRMASILARERVSVWLCPYEIIALTDRGGIIEAIPDTISLDSLKKNDANYTGLLDFFHLHFGHDTEELADAKANFAESLAGYSIVCFLLQLKDRHNGNILLDNRGHLIHIDFGFFFLSSPGKNAGFESAPFKLTREFVEVLGGPESRLFRTFRELCVRAFIVLRRHCMEIILLVEMLKNGNEELQCFRGRPDDAIQQLRDRFRLDLNDRACKEYVNSLVDNSIENWRTDWYDRYQRYFVGVL